jgi:hypothetical protein
MKYQKIAYPCIGFDGQGEAIRKLLPESEPVNVYDINFELSEVYKKRLNVDELDHEKSELNRGIEISFVFSQCVSPTCFGCVKAASLVPRLLQAGARSVPTASPSTEGRNQERSG